MGDEVPVLHGEAETHVGEFVGEDAIVNDDQPGIAPDEGLRHLKVHKEDLPIAADQVDPGVALEAVKRRSDDQRHRVMLSLIHI